MDSQSLHPVLETAEQIARRAGNILREYYYHPRQSDHKQTNIDLVTEADRDSEAYIVKALREAFPDHHIRGEEGGGYGPAPESTPFHWYVDPLDGTTNFAHRVPHFAVSMALSDAHMHPILGVIYDPMRGECFTTIKGEGVWLDKQPIRVSDITDLGQALVVTGFPYDSWTHPENNVVNVGNFLVRTQGVRRVGSAALDLAYVAAGRYEIYWERGAKPWDVQAGILCVLEAGGKVSDYQGNQNGLAYTGQYIVATNGHLHDWAVAVLTQGDKAPRPTPR